jgi:Fe2+ transport system protein FeoA
MWTTLDLEVKDESGNFEAYESEWIYLKAVAWQPNTTFDFTKPESCQAHVVKIHSKQNRVSDMEVALSTLFGIPQERLIIQLRHEKGYNNTVTCEYFNMDWRKPKLVGDFASLAHGVTLFVEENDPKGDFNNYKWKKEFDSEIEKITVNLSNVDDPEDTEFPLRIRVDRGDTVKQLKQVISDRIGLPVGEFYLVRKSNMQEIKEMNKSLASLGFSTGVNIKIVKGHAKNEGVFEVNISKVELIDESDKDSILFATEPVGKLEVSAELTGYLLKEAVCSLYNSKLPAGAAELTLADFRLRNPQNDFGSVVNDFDILEDLNLFDDKDIYLQINQPEKLVAYKGEDEADGKRLHILVREWDPETWQFGSLMEVEVPRTLKAVALGQYLHKTLFSHIPDNQFFGTRIAFFKSFIRSDLAMRAWFNLIQTPNVDLTKSKLELTRDSILVIVRDNSKPVREILTPDELKRYANQVFIDHVARKTINLSVAHKTQDELFKEAQARKPDWSKGKLKAESAVTITVGITATAET